MQIALLKNLLPVELQQRVWAECNLANWQYGHSSGSNNNAVAFWKMDLDHNSVITELWQAAKQHCEKQAGGDLGVIRQYANGHTFGQGGQPHQDDTREGCFTLLYYPMLEWQDQWDGETIFYDDNKEIHSSIKPHPNRGIFFDSTILHEGRAPSRYCGALRVTIAFKLERV